MCLYSRYTAHTTSPVLFYPYAASQRSRPILGREAGDVLPVLNQNEREHHLGRGIFSRRMGSTVVRDQDEDRLAGGARRCAANGHPGRGVQGGPTHHVRVLRCRSRAVMTCPSGIWSTGYQFLFHALIKPFSSSFAIEPAVRLLVARLHVCVWAVSFPAG